MTEFVTVFHTTGGVSVAVDDDYVSIQQESTMGDAPQGVSIPRPLFKEVLGSIFAAMEVFELRDISELAEAHAKAERKGG